MKEKLSPAQLDCIKQIHANGGYALLGNCGWIVNGWVGRWAGSSMGPMASTMAALSRKGYLKRVKSRNNYMSEVQLSDDGLKALEKAQ